MPQKIISVLLLLLIIAAGIGYAIYSDPELPEHRLFNQAIVEFSGIAGELEEQFKDRNSLESESRQFVVNYTDSNNSPATIPLAMGITNNLVTLRFGEGDTAMANQTIVLEPYFKNEEVRWKCLGGSVLLRYRSKACRLGNGIIFNKQSSTQ